MNNQDKIQHPSQQSYHKQEFGYLFLRLTLNFFKVNCVIWVIFENHARL